MIFQLILALLVPKAFLIVKVVQIRLFALNVKEIFIYLYIKILVCKIVQ